MEKIMFKLFIIIKLSKSAKTIRKDTPSSCDDFTYQKKIEFGLYKTP